MMTMTRILKSLKTKQTENQEKTRFLYAKRELFQELSVNLHLSVEFALW